MSLAAVKKSKEIVQPSPVPSFTQSPILSNLDNPKGLRVFFYQLGPSLHHPHGDGLQGRLPSQHLDPALPKLFWFTPAFPTCPTVAEQFLDIKRTSPEGNFNVADFPSFAISFATAPAALANCPPFPSVISMLCMAVPKGISVEVDSSYQSKPLPKLYKLLPKHTAFWM
ncbi:putative protein ycf72, partial [Cucurbita argyrosperma subsp. argyrosperma]